MNNKKILCENCLESVNYKVVVEELTRSLKGKKYTFSGKTAYCVNCNKPIYVEEINEHNKQAIYEAFRRENGIISNEDIINITEKYSIGAKPLAQLLGWGINTIQRYLNGDIPKPAYSDKLKEILKKPDIFKEILVTNKDNITDVAFNKSVEKVDEILNNENDDKLTQVIHYLLSKNNEITPLALQKLLYYVQGFYFSFKKDYIFSRDCEAWVHGPVYRDVYFKYQSFGYNPIQLNIKSDIGGSLTFFECSLIDSVLKNFAIFNGKVLEEFTHEEEPWLAMRGDLNAEELSNEIIPKELIGSYFVKVKEKYQMLGVEEISRYSFEKYKAISSL